MNSWPRWLSAPRPKSHSNLFSPEFRLYRVVLSTSRPERAFRIKARNRKALLAYINEEDHMGPHLYPKRCLWADKVTIERLPETKAERAERLSWRGVR